MNRSVRTLVVAFVAAALLFLLTAPNTAQSQTVPTTGYPVTTLPEETTSTTGETTTTTAATTTSTTLEEPTTTVTTAFAGPTTTGELPETGSDPLPIARVALVLLVVGAGLVIVTMRRRRPAS